MRNTLSLVSIALLLLAASVLSAQVVTGTMGSSFPQETKMRSRKAPLLPPSAAQ